MRVWAYAQTGRKRMDYCLNCRLPPDSCDGDNRCPFVAFERQDQQLSAQVSSSVRVILEALGRPVQTASTQGFQSSE